MAQATRRRRLIPYNSARRPLPGLTASETVSETLFKQSRLQLERYITTRNVRYSFTVLRAHHTREHCRRANKVSCIRINHGPPGIFLQSEYTWRILLRHLLMMTGISVCRLVEQFLNGTPHADINATIEKKVLQSLNQFGVTLAEARIQRIIRSYSSSGFVIPLVGSWLGNYKHRSRAAAMRQNIRTAKFALAIASVGEIPVTKCPSRTSAYKQRMCRLYYGTVWKCIRSAFKIFVSIHSAHCGRQVGWTSSAVKSSL
jgi:hypothetical protein